MSEALTTIENKIVELQKFCQERSNYLHQIEANIKQLKLERLNVQKQLSEVQGAVQGFAEASKLIKADAAVLAPPMTVPMKDVNVLEAPVVAKAVAK